MMVDQRRIVDSWQLEHLRLGRARMAVDADNTGGCFLLAPDSGVDSCVQSPQAFDP